MNAVVADIGAYSTKIGFAGEDYPKAYFRSVRCDFTIRMYTLTIILIDAVVLLVVWLQVI